MTGSDATVGCMMNVKPAVLSGETPAQDISGKRRGKTQTSHSQPTLVMLYHQLGIMSISSILPGTAPDFG